MFNDTFSKSMNLEPLHISTDNHGMRIPHRREERQLFLDRERVQPSRNPFVVGCDDRVLLGHLGLIARRWIGVVNKVNHSLFHLPLQFSEEEHESLPTSAVGFLFEFLYSGTRGSCGTHEPKDC